MLTLNNLSIYDQFSSEVSESMLLGDFSEKSRSWYLNDITDPSLKTTLTKLYSLLGVSQKQHFFTTKTRQCNYKKGQGFGPVIYKDHDGQLSIQFGYSFIPIYFSPLPDSNDPKIHESTFWFYGHPSDKDISAQQPIELLYEFNQVKDYETKQEYPYLSIQLNFDLDNGTQETISFKVIYSKDSTIEDRQLLRDLIKKQYTLRKTPEKAKKNEQDINALLSKIVAMTSLSPLSPIANLNRVFLSQFQANKEAITPETFVAIPFSGFNLNQSENPYYTLKANISKVIERFGDYEIEGFSKSRVMLSTVEKLAINQDTKLGREFDGKPSQPGVLIVQHASDDITHIPQCMVIFYQSMSATVKQLYGFDPNLTIESGTPNQSQPQKALGSFYDSVSNLAPDPIVVDVDELM